MFNPEDDADVYFLDHGREITCLGRKVRVIPDSRDEDFKGARHNEIFLRALTSECRDIDKETLFTYNGSVYKVSNKNQIFDGLFSLLEAAKTRI